MSDISINGVNANSAAAATSTTSKNTLDMDDFYKLMAAQLKNQDVSNPTDESDFMNQMMQMAVISAINTFTDISKTSYAASLVGRDVTIADIGNDGKPKEVYGTVTATGVYSGEQVIYVNDNRYALSQIMAIGKLPDTDSSSNSSSSG
ncbi:MAG: hypothetical protein LKJ13_02520 [Clostridia bacterium]|jgi:flagellar basal-body rod modification protein FlgD|nr:hypothetical protein [Clostridia bacterium]MCI1999859.1 hypothetical protein [Clostridia bacterium]MCI2014225.1 hypothetical protein [Clostridia bacterium]